MEANSDGRQAAAIDPADFLANAHRCLSEGLAATKGAVTWRLPSPTREFLAPGWVISGNGVETESHGLVIRGDDYPHFDDGGKLTLPVKMTAPAGVDPALYKLAVQRGAAHFEDRDDFW